MYITLVMNVWNVIAAYVLIFGVGSFQGMGVAGAGVATASARLIGSLLAFYCLFAGKALIRILPRDLFRWHRDLALTLVRLSLPTTGEAFLTRTGSTLFMRIISALGSESLAAHQIAVSVESLSFMPGWGLATAAATLTGQCLGAKKPDLAEKAIRHTLRLSLIVMNIIGVLFAIWGRQIVTVFGSTPDVLDLAGVAVRIAALEQASISIVMVLNGTLRGAGDTRTPMLVTLFGVLFFRVAVVYLFAIVLGWGLAGVWLGTAVDWAGRSVLEAKPKTYM
jgi:putative MATE family efflux protein